MSQKNSMSAKLFLQVSSSSKTDTSTKVIQKRLEIDNITKDGKKYL